eukprot:scpid69690/ scgid13812/ 
MASRQDFTPTVLGEYFMRFSQGHFQDGHCPILMPSDGGVTDVFGDLSESDDSALLHVIMEPDGSFFRLSQYINEDATHRIHAAFEEAGDVDIPEFIRTIDLLNGSMCLRLSGTRLVESEAMLLKTTVT